jgi:hypothetical protein
MESDDKKDYKTQANLSMKNQINHKLYISINNNASNNDKQRIKNTKRNNKIKKEINISNDNGNNGKEIPRIISENPNYSKCLNAQNINNDNNLYFYTPITRLKRKLVRTNKLVKKYKDNSFNKIKKGYESNMDNDLHSPKKISKSFKSELNDNHSAFNQIISKFQKFNENYKKYIKHTTESNVFNNAIFPKIINKFNKSTDVIVNTDKINRNNSLKKEIKKNLKLEAIKMSNNNKDKPNKNNLNSILKITLDKISSEKYKQNKRCNGDKETFLDNISNNKERQIFVNTNCIFINKIENLKNIKDKAPKSKIQIFSYNKLSDSIKRNNNNSLKSIPINFNTDRIKEEFKKNRIFINDKIRKNTIFNTIEVINKNPDEMTKRNNIKYNKTSLFNKIYNNSTINNNYIYRNIYRLKKNFYTQREIKGNKNFLVDKYVTTLNNSNFHDTISSYEYENQNSSRKKDIIVNNLFKTKGESIIGKLINSESENTFEYQIKNDISKDNNTFFCRNKNKTYKRFKNIRLYKKPIKSESNNKNSNMDSSQEKSLYKKKINENDLAKKYLNKLKISVSRNRNFNDKIKYLKPKIIKKVYMKDNWKDINKNLNKEDNTKNINVKINNDDNCINLNIDNNHTYYMKLPIKKICFIEKIKTYKKGELYNDLENNSPNGKDILINKNRNYSLELLKNGQEYFKAKTLNEFDNKMINEFKSENTSDNKIIFDTNIYGKNLMIEKQNKKALKRSMTKEKFALGFSKLNKILSKNSRLCHIFNGLEITEKLYK